MAKTNNITGETESGFRYKIKKDDLENYELLEVLSEVEENPLLITKTIVLLLGKEQKDKLKDHLRKENGTVSVEKMTQEIMEIFESQNKAKNS